MEINFNDLWNDASNGQLLKLFVMAMYPDYPWEVNEEARWAYGYEERDDCDPQRVPAQPIPGERVWCKLDWSDTLTETGEECGTVVVTIWSPPPAAPKKWTDIIGDDSLNALQKRLLITKDLRKKYPFMKDKVRDKLANSLVEQQTEALEKPAPFFELTIDFSLSFFRGEADFVIDLTPPHTNHELPSASVGRYDGAKPGKRLGLKALSEALPLNPRALLDKITKQMAESGMRFARMELTCAPDALRGEYDRAKRVGR